MKAFGRLGSVGVILLLVFCPGNIRAQIAPGVLQSAAQTATISGSVIQSDGTPVADADIKLIGPAILATKSDAHGLFNFTSVPYGVYHIIAATMNLGTASRGNVIVKGDTNIVVQYVTRAAEGLKTIATVSTQSSGAQINVTPASIASVNPSEYAFEGNTSWRQLLNRIPGVTVSGNLFAGDNTHDNIPDSPIEPVVLSINGALPYETSVTLDGMPLINTTLDGVPGAGADLAFLPMSTFDTADVVRGPGADAPSIVDSIGGSFVLHAPGQVDSDQVEFSASNDPYGGIVSNIQARLHLGKLSATLAYSVNDTPGPLGNQNVISAYALTPLTVNGQPFLSGGFLGYAPGPSQYQNCHCVFKDSLLYCCDPISTAWTEHSGAISLSYNVTPSVNAQIFYAGSSYAMQNPNEIFVTDFVPGAGYNGGITPGFHNYNEAFGPTLLAESANLLEEKITAYFGGRGVLRLAAVQDNSFTYDSTADQHPDGQYTLYGTGYYTAAPGTAVNFNGTSANLTFTPYTQSTSGWVNNRDFLASYALQIGAKSSLGISFVKSYYNSPGGGSYFYGTPLNCAFSGSAPSAISETTNETRLHVGTEISDKVTLDASWYFTKSTYHVPNPNGGAAQYTFNCCPGGVFEIVGGQPSSYIDSTLSYSAPRLSVVWRASRNMAIRAAAGGGYALPALSNLVGSSAIYLCGPYYQYYKTNLDLAPEKSFGFDVGTDIRLHHETVLSFDLYHTNLFGQFFNSTTLTSANYNGTGLPLYTSQYQNLGQSRFEGINIDIRHDVLKGIYWHGALGLTRAYVVNVSQAGFYNTATCFDCANTYIVPGINFDGEYQSTVPYANGSAQLGYRWSSGKYVDLSPTYYGNNNSYFVPAFVEIDAHVGYELTKNVSLLATFRNITNIYGQSYRTLLPTQGAPAIAGLPYPLFEIPYGPRALIVTAMFKE